MQGKRKEYDRKGNQRLQCRTCGKTYSEARANHLREMYLPIEKAEPVEVTETIDKRPVA